MSSLCLSGLNEGVAFSVHIGICAVVAMVAAGAGGKAWGTGVTVGTGGLVGKTGVGGRMVSGGLGDRKGDREGEHEGDRGGEHGGLTGGGVRSLRLMSGDSVKEPGS